LFARFGCFDAALIRGCVAAGGRWLFAEGWLIGFSLQRWRGLVRRRWGLAVGHIKPVGRRGGGRKPAETLRILRLSLNAATVFRIGTRLRWLAAGAVRYGQILLDRPGC
jgi:hypothetical protein